MKILKKELFDTEKKKDKIACFFKKKRNAENNNLILSGKKYNEIWRASFRYKTEIFFSNEKKNISGYGLSRIGRFI